MSQGAVEGMWVLIKFPANSPRATGVGPKLSWYVMDCFLGVLDITDGICLFFLVVTDTENTGSNGKHFRRVKQTDGD